MCYSAEAWTLYDAYVKEFGAEIDIKDDGLVTVAAIDGESIEKAMNWIKGLVEEPEVGKIYDGTVVKIMDFGAFVKIGHETEGLVHISEIAPFRVEKVSDILKEGDIVPIKVIKVDERGRLNLSIKEADGNFFKKEDK